MKSGRVVPTNAVVTTTAVTAATARLRRCFTVVPHFFSLVQHSADALMVRVLLEPPQRRYAHFGGRRWEPRCERAMGIASAGDPSRRYGFTVIAKRSRWQWVVSFL